VLDPAHDDRSGLAAAPRRIELVAMQVLLVEDEPFLADTIKRGLSDHGYSVDVARTGDQGLELALGHAYRGILLDVMLPGMHGDEVLRELRAREIRTPVILLTAKDGGYDRARALDEGADDFLAKPFSFVALLDRLGVLTTGGSDF
jgi:two-component system OmpR family response regulator